MGLHLLLLLNACKRGSVWLKFLLQPLLSHSLYVLIHRLIELTLGLWVEEVIRGGVGHLRSAVRFDASKQHYSLRQLVELMLNGVVRLLCGLWGRRRRTPLRFGLTFYRAMLEASTLPVGVVSPLRRGFGLLLDLLGD